MVANKDHRIEFNGKRRIQQYAPPSYRVQTVSAETFDKAVDKLKEKYIVKQIY